MARQQADKTQTHSQCFVMQKIRALEKTSFYTLLDNAFLSPSTKSLKLKRYTEKRSVRFKWLGKHWFSSVLVSLECHNKKTTDWGLKQQMFMFWQVWKPKLKVPAGLVPREASLPGLQTATFLLSPHTALPLHSERVMRPLPRLTRTPVLSP